MKVAAILKLPLKLLEVPAGWAAKKLSPWTEAPAETLSPEIPYIPVSRPVNFHQLPPTFAAGFIAAKKIPARRLFRIQNANVGGQATVFKGMRIFLPSLPWLQSLEEHRNPKLLLKQWWPNKKSLPETVALVYDQWSGENYYHWMIESLPRIELLLQKYPECPVLVPQPTPSFISRTLQLMGVSNLIYLPKQLLYAASTTTIMFPELVYYDNVATKEEYIDNNGNIEPILTVRQKLLQGRKPAEPPFRKVYVSRQQQKTRYLLNEDAVLELVTKLDFEIVYFEQMSFDQQVALMQETLVMVGVHGANMVNLLFLPEKATVVELMNEAYVNDAYYLLASTLSLAYFVVPCTMPSHLDPAENEATVINDAALQVSPSLLQQTLLQALSFVNPPLQSQ
jgi:capsular polysaccharide biosynthesis protein